MNELVLEVSSKDRQLLDEFEARNAVALASSSTEEDAPLITPHEKAVTGLASITELFERFLQNGQYRLDLRPSSEDDTQDSGDRVRTIV